MEKVHTRSFQEIRHLISSIFFVLAIFLLALMLVSFGSLGWPGLHWDSALYGTPVINVALGKGWLFGGYGPLISEKSDLSYNFHGILHVFLYGKMLQASTWSSYLFFQGIVNAITATAYSSVSLFVQLSESRQNLYSMLLSLLIGIVSGVICIGLQGRPEQLVPLILCLSLVSIRLITNRNYLSLVHGLVFGLLTALSPLVGVFYAVIALFYMYGISSANLFEFFKSGSLIILVGTLVAASLILTMTPFSPIGWFYSVAGSAGSVINFEGLLLKIRGYIFGFTLIAPGWNLFSLLLIAAGGAWLWVRSRNIISLFLFALAFAFFNEKMCDYGYSAFIPFGFALCLPLLSVSRCSFVVSPWQLIVFRAGALIGAGSYLAILVSYVLVVMHVPFSELSPDLAHQRFSVSEAGRELSSGLSAVGFPAQSRPSMIILGEANTSFASFNPALHPSSDRALDLYENRTGMRVNWFVFPQTLARVNPKPPKSIFVGDHRYDLFDDLWQPPGVLDFRLKPAWLTNRNNFSLYKRET